MPESNYRVRGVNHLALVCSDMRRTVEFYRTLLGFPLIKTIELGGGKGQHFFFDVGKGDALAFFWFPGAPAATPGVAAPAMLPGRGDIVSGVGSMNHVAFDVAPEEIEDYARRLRDAGIDCIGPVNHDDSESGWSKELYDGVFMRSVYFFDPDGLALEFAAWLRTPTASDVRHEPRSPEVVAS